MVFKRASSRRPKAAAQEEEVTDEKGGSGGRRASSKTSQQPQRRGPASVVNEVKEEATALDLQVMHATLAGCVCLAWLLVFLMVGAHARGLE